MGGTPMFIGRDELLALEGLRTLAAANPVDMLPLMERLKSAAGKRAHKEQMTRQTIKIPFDYWVTFSIELNHPVGTCRHMSMSVDREGRSPNEIAVWTVAKELGFVDGLHACRVWIENLDRPGDVAINVVQPIAVSDQAGAA